MYLIMVYFKRPLIRTVLLMLSGLCTALPAPAVADLIGYWTLTGTLQVNSSVAGKAIALKQTKQLLYARFSNELNPPFLLGSAIPATSALSLAGSWKQQKSTLTVTLDPASVRALLRVIERDLRGRSGFSATLETNSAKLTATQRKDGKLAGSLLIKASAIFLGPSNKKGTLTLGYNFLGTPNLD